MVTGSTPISALPTGTIDNLLAVISMSIGMPSSPQTIREPLLILRDYLLPPEYIDGLALTYLSTGSISVGAGTAYIPSLNKAIHVTGSVTVNAANPGTNPSGSWRHVYLYENSGVPSFEISSDVPSEPYAGVARTRTGNTSRRWIGSLYHNSAGHLHNFNTNVQGNVLLIGWEVPTIGTVFEYTNISGAVVTRSAAHLMPVTDGGVTEILLNMVFVMGANSVILGAVGEDWDGANIDSFDLYQRLAANASPSNYGGTPTPMKISGTTFKAMTSHLAGNGSMSIRVRGITIQR